MNESAKDQALALDVTGHGLLARFHEGCRCPWCTSRARECPCLCPDCVAVKTTGVYVILTSSDRAGTAAVATGQDSRGGNQLLTGQRAITSGGHAQQS